MRKSRKDFKVVAEKAKFELDLENAPEGHRGFVTFLDPNKLPTHGGFDLQRERDPEKVFRKILSAEDFAAWWEEWKDTPTDETNKLLEDVLEHYGSNR
jgi:hypothetical protein